MNEFLTVHRGRYSNGPLDRRRGLILESGPSVVECEIVVNKFSKLITIKWVIFWLIGRPPPWQSRARFTLIIICMKTWAAPLPRTVSLFVLFMNLSFGSLSNRFASNENNKPNGLVNHNVVTRWISGRNSETQRGEPCFISTNKKDFREIHGFQWKRTSASSVRWVGIAWFHVKPLQCVGKVSLGSVRTEDS